MTEPTPKLSAALVKALAELTVLDRGKTASIPTKSGGNFTYSYADIADVVAATRPVLAANGLVALTPVHGSGKGLACTVTLIHESGEERVFDPLPFPASPDPQQAGSAITYFRRYALLAALGMATADDDGAAGSQHARSSGGRKSSRSAALADAETVTYIRNVVGNIGDEGQRKEIEAAFKAEFGPTASLPASRAAEAKAWIDQAVPA